MNGYRLFGKPIVGSSSPDYRGTYRPDPDYKDELPAESPINQLWLNETDLMIGDCFTRLEEAERIQNIYAEAGFYYDLVMLGEKDWIPPNPDCLRFMGYDISHISDYSLLSWDLNFEKPAPEYWHQRENPIYQPLLLLIQKYFRPHLNQYRLLPTVEDAEFFLSVVVAMKEGFGTVWESVEYGPFSLVKMYMIRSGEDMMYLAGDAIT